MAIQRLSWFRTIAMAFFAFAFTSLALYGIFVGSVNAPSKYFGNFSLVGEPLQFWVVTTFYFATSAACGYLAYFFAPIRNAA